ncbi:MAG TPA: CorA family divalent cation transporter [Chloroflexota bacterium]|nr:CorA family divalent cation transporter [Chloroflexota bacterium]
MAWLALERPGPAELELLRERLGISRLTLDDLTSRGEPPRVEHHPGYDFAVLHFPVLHARPRRLAAGELRMVVGADFVLTVHDGDLRSLVALFDDLQADPGRRDELMGSPGRLAQAIARTLLIATAGWGERVGAALEQLQEAVLGGPTAAIPRQLLALAREIDEVRWFAAPMPALLGQLSAAPFAGGEDVAAAWRDTADLAERQGRQLSGVAAALGALDRALAHRLSERRNTLLRTVAVLLATTLPSLVVAALYGTGLRGLPGADSEWAFEIALALTLAAGVLTVGLLRRARWL